MKQKKGEAPDPLRPSSEPEYKALLAEWPPPALLSAGYIASGFIFGSLTDIFYLLLPLLHSRRFSSFPDLLFIALTDLLAAALILMDSFPDLLLPSFLELPRRVAALPAPPPGPACPDAANAKVEAIINTLTICLLYITSSTNRVDRPDISAIKIG